MASGKTPLKVVFSQTALDELTAIWRWNAQEHGVSHADKYVDFLKRVIYSLDKTHPFGRLVPSRPDLCYVLIKRRSRGHGHVAVYAINDEVVDVLHIFHTAQNWHTKLS